MSTCLRAANGRGLVLPLLLIWSALAPAAVDAHPGNVIATLSVRPAGEQGVLEAILTFDGTGEPLLGATLSWSEAPPAIMTPAPFRFGGGPNVRVASLPVPRTTTRYTLHILSLGETTEGTFELVPRADGLEVSPRELLLVFPDVGLPDYQLALIIVLIVVGMVVIIGRGPGGGSPRPERGTS